MKTELQPRNTQTRVKHEILSQYLDTWAGIIVNGLRNRPNPGWHFIYVDCFAYVGQYAGETEEVFRGQTPQPVYGSPVIGIRALDKLAIHARKAGIDLDVNAVLIEKKKSCYEDLLETLCQIGLEKRIKKTTDLTSLTRGEIAVVNADCLSIVDDLVSYTTNGHTWAFYLVDPHGPSGIPYNFVRSIVKQERHDVMINFIYEDLLRKTGMCLNENLRPQHQQLVDNWTRAFGSDRWKQIARDTLLEIQDHRYFRDEVLGGVPLDDMENGSLLTDEELTRLKERKFVDAYRDVLRGMDPKLVTKLVDLRFCDRERTMFYLFLTTHDATGALCLNEILNDAKYLEYELRYRLDIAKRTAPPPGQLPLLSVEPDVPKRIISTRPNAEEIAKNILQRLHGQSLKRRQVYQELVDELFFPSEVDKAIKFLKKIGKAEFDGSLKHNTEIRFAEA